MFLQSDFQFLLMAIQWVFLVVLGAFAEGTLFPIGDGSFEYAVEKNKIGRLFLGVFK